MDLIYEKYLVNDFDLDELRPLESIQYLYYKKMYHPFKASDNDEMVGYAFLYINKENVLLDYFATIYNYRNNGYGSKFLKRILRKYSKKNLFIAVADPDNANDDKERYQMNKRIEFYKKNGVNLTGIRVNMFGVNYRIMTPNNINDDIVKQEFSNIYKSMMPIRNFNRSVMVY